MAGQKILLPYNFTRNDQKALDFVILNYALREDVRITLFNAYTPAPEVEVRGSPVMDKMKGHIGFFSQKVSEQQEELNSVEERLRTKGFAEGQVDVVFKPKKRDVAGDIIDMALSGHYDLVVLNRQATSVKRFFTGSVFSKVITALRGKAVCVIS